MTNSAFDVRDLIRLAQAELRDREFGQEFMLSDVYNISRRAYEKYPEDPVIRQFAFVIERLLEKRGSTTTITQKEMSEIYNNFTRLSSNSRFRDVMGAFVFNKQANTPRNAAENRADVERDPIDLQTDLDRDLASGLQNAFQDKAMAEQVFSQEIAKKGIDLVKAELESIGFENVNVKFAGGDANAFVYTANFDTRSGLVSVAVPIETTSGKMLLPSVFVADSGFEKLNAQNLKSFIEKKANSYDFSIPETSAVLKAIAILTGRINTASKSFETMLEKLGGGEFIREPKHDLDCDISLSTTAATADDRNEILPKNTPEESSYSLNMSSNHAFDSRAEMPKELTHLAQDFEDRILESASSFGKNAIQIGRNMVAAELSSAGFKNSQVKFASENEDSAVYVASINTSKGPLELEIPVEMKDTGGNRYEPLLPSCFACDGVIEDFTPTKLQRFVLRHTPSTGQTVYSSIYSHMTLPELKDSLIKSASENDYVECEMILNSVQDRFNEEEYKNTVSDYHYMLTLKNDNGKIVRKCSREIPAGKVSIEPMCSHYNLPMSQVFVDENGVCHKKTSVAREKLNPISESGVGISTSKIILS